MIHAKTKQPHLVSALDTAKLFMFIEGLLCVSSDSRHIKTAALRWLHLHNATELQL